MWQRIQTLWWCVSIVALVLFATQDFLLLRLEGQTLISFVQSSTGIRQIGAEGDMIYSNWAVAIISGISVALSLVSIFIYKMRSFQIRLSILNALVLVGLICTVAYVAYYFMSQSGAEFAGITLYLSLPLVGIICQVLAARAVLHDEVLVRMSNRIR